MSGLKDRLRRLTGGTSGARSATGTQTNGETGAEPQAEAGKGTERTADQSVGVDHGSDVPVIRSDEGELPDARWKAFEATLEMNGKGSFIKRRRLYGEGYCHGRYRLGELSERAAALAAFHGGTPVRHDELLFFDTETTGLGIGAGNVPFLIGIGFWEEDGRFAVEQLFIRNPAEEAAMLEYLQRKLDRYPRLVTYNGRSFDWPIVKSRFVMNRMRAPEGEPIHLDFLYPSRSLWRGTLPSCRLGHVEEERLGFQREDDVPGAMAPALYFQYLSSGDGNPDTIRPVFIHNEHDVLSLASLAVHFARALEGELDLAAMEPEETYRTGLWLDRMGRKELADSVLRGLEQSDSAEAAPYRIPLAAYLKRKGEYERAVSLWLKAVRQTDGKGQALSLEPYIELAIHYEHRMKDFETALQFTEEALSIALRRSSLARRSGGANRTELHIAELDKRRRRLQEKRARCADKAPERRASSGMRTANGKTAGGSVTSRQTAVPNGKRKRKTSEADIAEMPTLF